MKKQTDIVTGLPIHATNEDNTLTFCGLEVNKNMSFHRGGFFESLIKDKGFICKKCFEKWVSRKKK